MNLTLGEKIMYATIPITMLDNQQHPTGTASGFCFSFCANQQAGSYIPVLVTNRHVLGDCAFISVVFTEATADGRPNVGHVISATFPSSSCVFHPNRDVDLAVLPIGPFVNGLAKRGRHVFYTQLDKTLIPQPQVWNELDAIEEVTMVGYPKGLRDKVNNLPIFRRGITATHPAYNYQGKPQFLVDMACFPGSSGSPVFLLNEGSYYDSRSRSLCLGKSRVYFLGVQYAVPNVKESGSLAATLSVQSKIVPVMQSYINLGFIIKSTELLAFEPIFQSMTNE